MAAAAKATPGLRERHARSCATTAGGRCSCSPSIEAWAYSRVDGKKLRRTFRGPGAKAAARKWRADAITQLDRGTIRAQTSARVRDAADAWVAGAVDGSIRTRSGDRYKPSAVRAYRRALELRIKPAIGAHRLSEVTRPVLQALVDRWMADGLDASTIRNSVMPVRAIYRRAVSRGEVAVNPTAGLELPAVRGRRDRIASPAEAADLLATLGEADRALYATAFYAGLRRGELMALRWEDVDLDVNVIRVERSWDERAGVIDPKSRAGRRTVPVARALRDELLRHRMRSGRREGLVFGRDAERPFNPSTVGERAVKVWLAENLRRGELDEQDGRRRPRIAPLGLHECRHTFASMMIAAGVNAKALSSFMGHASITITLDRYGHLMPGAESDAAGLLDGYLEKSAAS
jgi:integrase